MALDCAEKMKTEASGPRQTLIHELLLQTILDPRPIVKRTAATTAQQTTWLKDTAPLDPAWKKRMRQPYKLHIDTLSAYTECLKVSHRSRGSTSRAADGGAQGDEGPEWKGEHMSYYLVFLDRLERLGEAALNTGGGKDAQVAMDVDPSPKRQRTGDYTPTSLSSPVSSVPPRSTSTPQRTSIRVQLQQQQASQFPTPRPPVPPSPIAPTIPTMSAPTILSNFAPASASSPVQAQASAGLAALESLF
ncbi:hypothetical protein EDB85DRAFT_2144747 [Lactarius pseudohatsudake]|nr:hypothetical protein EDB85DRAFT_2144747 [Lactarius pseudohatsudake]